MPTVNFLSKSEVRSIVINELRKKEKIITKTQLNELIKQIITDNTKCIYREMDKIRGRLNELEK